MDLVGKVMSLLLHMLSRLVITFLPRSKRLLISQLQSPSAVILEPPKIKSDTVSTVSQEVMGPDAMILVFWMSSFKPTFSLSCFTFGQILNLKDKHNPPRLSCAVFSLSAVSFILIAIFPELCKAITSRFGVSSHCCHHTLKINQETF